MMSLGRALPQRGSRNGSKHNLALAPPDSRLSIIAEDPINPPAMPEPPPVRAHHRPFSRRWGDPPRHSFDQSPPDYEVWDVTGPKGEKLLDVRNNKYIARRGGWKRLCIFALLAIIAIVALAVGLAIGLRRNDSSNSNQAPAASNSSSVCPNGPFPTGCYEITTFLESAPTNCTSKPGTWRCYPYATYASSPSTAQAIFNWIITGTLQNFTISSTDNPFAPMFTNTSLSLVDAGMPTEHYLFTVSLDKPVTPYPAISSSQAICQFNHTTFQGQLYTKKPNTYPTVPSTIPINSSNSTGIAPVGNIIPWPYAVQVSQYIGGGPNVPSCYEISNGNLGAPITNGLTSQPSDQQCDCTYKNYD